MLWQILFQGLQLISCCNIKCELCKTHLISIKLFHVYFQNFVGVKRSLRLMFDLLMLFTFMCTGPAGITAKRQRLIPGSLPTEYMPVRTVETPRVPERKPPVRTYLLLF